MARHKKQTVVLEITGGCLSAVYADEPGSLSVILIDHDSAEISEQVANSRSEIDMDDFSTYDRR